MKEKFKENDYIKWGVTLFGVVAASIILFFVLSKLELLFDFLLKLMGILSPIFLGIMFAYLLNPLVKLIEKYFTKYIVDYIYKKVFKKAKGKARVARLTAIFTTYLLAIILIVLFFKFVVPSLFESINLMLTNVPVYITFTTNSKTS